jgi:hypothetical protein
MAEAADEELVSAGGGKVDLSSSKAHNVRFSRQGDAT